MALRTSKSPLKLLRASDARGVAQLAAQATVGAARIAEGLHQSIRGTLGLPGGKRPGQTRGITGLVYRSVEGLVQLLGKGADKVLAGLEPLLGAADQWAPDDPRREAVLAALNGVIGDRLAAGNNPLSTRMSLRLEGKPLDLHATKPLPATAGTGKLLLLVHGLCMNDLQWQPASRTGGSGVGEKAATACDHGRELAAALGYTPLYLRYNSGLHTSENGRVLAGQLEQLIASWPNPIEELAIVAHSMGGLVARSAVHHAQQHGMRWPTTLKHIVFLGTPHHGAPLEKAGNWVDVLLGSTPWSKPFAQLARLRSAGITDLRHGNLLDTDWQGRDRFEAGQDTRRPVPLPAGVACYTVAATLAGQRSLLADRLVGDGLVPLRSALGEHGTAGHSLGFPKATRCVVPRMNHLQLLWSPVVARQMVAWLTPAPGDPDPARP